MRHPFFALPGPLVFGHRGACGERPENTLASFEHALAQGAQIIETDVRRTRDGEVVTLHDGDVARTTDGRGDVAELSYEEVLRLDAGYRFATPDGDTPFRACGLRVARLADAFERFPGVRFNVELKRCDPRLVSAVVELVHKHGRERITLLAAESDETMSLLRSDLRERDVAAATGASLGDVVGFVRAAVGVGEPPREPMALQIPAHFAGQPLATRALIEFAHAHDVQVHVWTVNEPAEMRRLLELGVDGLMSDFPGRLREVVEAWRPRG